MPRRSLRETPACSRTRSMASSRSSTSACRALSSFVAAVIMAVLLDKGVDGILDLEPVASHVPQALLPRGREPVVAARRPGRRDGGAHGQEAVALQPRQQGVDRALGGGQAGGAVKLLDDLIAVRLAAPERRQDAQLDEALAE